MAGPPGYGSPKTRATLSKHSPAASSRVSPRCRIGSRARSRTSSSEVCPPETISTTHGSGSGPCARVSAATCPARWCTPYSGTPIAYARPLAPASPTCNAPERPGPVVTATASMPDSRRPARESASRTTGPKACRWARAAISGTTPPNRACSSMLDATACPSSRPPDTMPAPVSSHDDSIPSTTGKRTTTPLAPSLHLQLIGNKVYRGRAARAPGAGPAAFRPAARWPWGRLLSGTIRLHNGRTRTLRWRT